MRFVDEYRRSEDVRRLADRLAAVTHSPWKIMEVCGGQTHAIIRFGLDQLLPPQLTLVHGPGCPVCVTPIELVDRAVALAGRPEIILCSFGDMLRVPGSSRDLMSARASGGDVRIVYSPMDALKLARENPDREVVFFAVGFETTAPGNAATLQLAQHAGIRNFSMLVSHVLVPPAIRAIMDSPETAVNGFLAAGHVCSVAGYVEYEELARSYEVPIVVTGFEPVDILSGLLRCVELLEQGRCDVVNQYARVVRREGNPQALAAIRSVFRVVDRQWRGIGMIPQSGLGLRPEFEHFDAEKRFDVGTISVKESGDCMSGSILQGIRRPTDCPAFGTRCTPEHPLGATMVSSEGACAAYYRYRRRQSAEVPHE